MHWYLTQFFIWGDSFVDIVLGIDMLFFFFLARAPKPEAQVCPLMSHFKLILFVGLLVNVMQLLAHQLIFNEVAHNLVVEVLDGSPLDALLDVLFLREKT